MYNLNGQLEKEDRVIEPDLTKCRFNKYGFSLVELLVVISVIAILSSILVPTLSKVKRQARSIHSKNNMHQIVQAVSVFASDNRDRYPASVASNGRGRYLTWTVPTSMIAIDDLGPRTHRSISGYLKRYIPDSSTIYCPSTPSKLKYMEESWEIGDDWDNPDNGFGLDPLSGSYCIYWNYFGYLPDKDRAFRGPQTMSGMHGESKMLVSDYFGYDHWRFPDAYGSCEKFRNSDVVDERNMSSSLWSLWTTSSKEIDFQIKPGTVIGVLGRTGSGKTTLARLVFRLYDPTHGRITLGGVPLTQALLAALHARHGALRLLGLLGKVLVVDENNRFLGEIQISSIFENLIQSGSAKEEENEDKEEEAHD